MPKQTETDPYAPPPMHHDRSGPVLRVALLAGMLGVAGLGYAWFSNQEVTPLVPAAEEQQVADAGYSVTPEAVPESLPPEPAVTTPAPAPRRAPAARVAEPTPEPEPTPAPAVTPVPTAPTPLPPMDTPPVGATGE